MPQGVEVQVLFRPPNFMSEKTPDWVVSSPESRLGRLTAYYGWTDLVRQQVIKKSRQAHVAAACPGDATERFADLNSLERWLNKKQPDVYALRNGIDLAGIIWHRPEYYPEASNYSPGHTFAIRLYKPYEGKGLAYPFMDECLRHYVQLCSQRGQLDNFGMWLSTKDEPRMANFYKRYGYLETFRKDGRLHMTLSDDKIRQVLLGA